MTKNVLTDRTPGILLSTDRRLLSVQFSLQILKPRAPV